MELKETSISREIVFNGKIFTVAKDVSMLPDGRKAPRELVLHAGGAGVLPVDEDKTVTLVRQYRCGAMQCVTEICAGKLEIGEDPKECAVRELSEELGITAENVVSLGHLLPTPAYDSEVTHIFLATGLTHSDSHLDDGEFLEVVKLPLDKAVELVMDGTITDAKTQIALLKAERLINGKA